MKKSIPLLLFISLGICISFPLNATYQLLDHPLGTRAAAMGGAFTGAATGPEAIFYNPASPLTMAHPSYKSEYGQLLGTDFLTISAQKPADLDGVRAAYLVSWVNDIPLSVMNAQNQPEYTSYATSMQFHYIRTSFLSSFWDISTAFIAKGAYQKLYTSTAYVLSTEVAFSKKLSVYNLPMTMGLLIHDFLATPIRWETGHQDFLPMGARGGLSIGTDNQTLILDIDGHARRYYDTITKKSMLTLTYHIGGEYWLLGHPKTDIGLALRSGYSQDSLSGGVGLLLNDILVDVALSFPHDTYKETTWRGSIGWRSFDYIPVYTFTPPKITPPDTSEFSLLSTLSTEKPLPLPTPPDDDAFLLLTPTEEIASPLAPSDFPIKRSQPRQPLRGTIDIDKTTKQLTLQLINPGWIDKIRVLNKTVSTKSIDKKIVIKNTYIDMPIKVLFYSKEIDDIVIINIQTTQSEHVIISGYLPINHVIDINQTKQIPSADQSFFHKERLQSKVFEIQFKLYVK